jgi:Flp pilus assembly pilin Flp
MDEFVAWGDSPERRSDMLKFLKTLGRDESGQDLAEYAIALAVITVAVVLAVQVVGTNVRSIWQNAATAIQQAS